MRKILLGIFLVVLVVALFYKSPFSAMYNFNKAKEFYQNRQYEQSLPYFERALFATPNDSLMRYSYVIALSKAKPTYSVQKKLYTIANSEPKDEATKTAKTSVAILKRRLLAEFRNNYISHAVDGNEVLHWDIKSFPLKVYMENPDEVPQYYIDNINKALSIWTRRTNFIKFTQVNDKQSADIVISFMDIPKDICSSNVCNYTIAYTEPKVNNQKILKKMNLTFYKTDPLNKKFTSSEILNTALHELGHTLGIMGHSDNPRDLMYATKNNGDRYFNSLPPPDLTVNDLRTLVLLYRIKPTISNNANLHSETFYYAPIIIGSEDERLQKKITEFERYVQKYPTIASGYINLASTYAETGDLNAGLKTLDKGERYVKNNDERYLIEYNKAVIYLNMQKLDEAINCAHRAQSIKNDDSIQELITEIENLKG